MRQTKGLLEEKVGAARRWADTANDERIGGDGRRLAGMKGAQNIAQDGGLASGIHISPGARPPLQITNER